MANVNTAGAISRITKEIFHLQTGSDLSLAVACRDEDVRHVRALIIGPPETPYEYGFFEFDVRFGKEYPIKSPNVRAITTNGGATRFNPNIYNCGKVCLSILGTWRGEPGEEWSSAQGLESVLLSIQSLMSSNPYENEPGHETAKKEEPETKAYAEKIRHETLRIAVVTRLEALLGIEEVKGQATDKDPRKRSLSSSHDSNSSPEPPTKHVQAKDTSGLSTPDTETSAHEYDAEATFAALQGKWDPFGDLFKRRFLWYYDTYAKTIEAAKQQYPKKQPFSRAQFEYSPNTMQGHFEYPVLSTRLDRIASALETEREDWIKKGRAQVAENSQIATQLSFQFKQLQHHWNTTQYTCFKLELSLPDPTNPFFIHITFFGRPMTNLDGGIFNLSLTIPPNFPSAQPRVKFVTPIFHHRVSRGGYLCYFPKKEDELGSHVEAIVKAIEDEDATYDPRAVINPEAFKLKWGSEAERKVYGRRVRRSAQDSVEI